MTHATATAVPTTDLDLFSDEVLGNPTTYHNQLREQGTVVRVPANDVWAITRYDQVRDALGDPLTFSSTKVAFNDTSNGYLRGTSLASDPPQHGPLRAALSENLNNRAMRKMKDDIFAKGDVLVRELAATGEFDGMTELAEAFPVSIVMDLIGIQGEIREKMLPWGEAAFNMLGPLNERATSGLPLVGELVEWTHHTVKADDLLEGSIGRALFAAAERGDIPHEACGMIIHQYIAAGLDTTITSIGNALELFAAHPDQFELLRSDLSLVPAAFMEVLRLRTPAPVLGRGTTRDVEVDGTTIPAGAQVALLLDAGNLDPRHYDNPEVFDIRRNPVDNLGFGYGIHGCAGQALARLEAQAVIKALATHVESYTVARTERRLNNFTHPFSSIEITDVVLA